MANGPLPMQLWRSATMIKNSESEAKTLVVRHLVSSALGTNGSGVTKPLWRFKMVPIVVKHGTKGGGVQIDGQFALPASTDEALIQPGWGCGC